MLLQIFVITTLTTLVKSEIAAEWTCKDVNQMGNCSSLPKISPLLEMLNKGYRVEFGDLNIDYCPFNIIERNAKCIHSYFHSCYSYMTDKEKLFFLMNLPKIQNSKTLCTESQTYKKEYREHMTCMKTMIKHKDEAPYKEWQEYFEDQRWVYKWKKQQDLNNDQIKDIVDLHFWRKIEPRKCLYAIGYMELRYKQLRERCGLKTEKFFRQLFSNLWPLSTINKNCDKDLFFEIV